MFECHITCYTSQADKASAVAKTLHWKTSEIARDPVLGNDTYFYLTSHSNDLTHMMDRMKTATKTLQDFGVQIVREKIEVIIHDTKTMKGPSNV